MMARMCGARLSLGMFADAAAACLGSRSPLEYMISIMISMEIEGNLHDQRRLSYS